MFYPSGGSPTTFKFPEERRFLPTLQRRLALPYGGPRRHTDLTVGRYAGLVSFTQNKVGTEFVELGMYDLGDKQAEVFSVKGASGVLVWHNGKACIVDQLHSRQNEGGSTSNHVTYCTPGCSSMLTFTAPPSQLENNINGFSLSSTSCFCTHS